MPIANEVVPRLTTAIARPAVRQAAAQASESTEKAAAIAFGQDTHIGTIADHAAYFDTNFDRIITVKETRQGLQDLGFKTALTWAMAPVANLVLGDGLRAPGGSSLLYRMKYLFTVNLDHLAASAKAEAGGKPMDAVARVESQMAFDTKGQGSLTLDEVGQWVDQVEHPGQSNGRTKAGFGQLFKVAADTTQSVTVNGETQARPAMSREALEHFYEGKLFYDIAARNGHPHPLPPGR